MTEIIERKLTPEEEAERAEYEANTYQRELEAVRIARQFAYQNESDPLNFKYQETGLEEDRQAWLDKKAEIQARIPEPTAPKK